MSFFINNKKIFFSSLAILVFGVLLAPNIARASDIVETVIGFVLVSIFAPIIAIGITIAVWLLELALNINLKVMSSPMVTTGWSIILSFTNLGFVLAIIVMAFATILRQESYGMKQILWKLIVAALLVNFSLVICGAFISVSDILTNYFLSKITSDNGAVGTTTNVATAIGNFFKIQMLAKVQDTFDATSVKSAATSLANTAGAAGIVVIVGGVFVNIFSLLIFITILAMVVMLLIRYVYLGIILIFSPIVWLLWILPSTATYWHQWWKEFLRWTFFPPIVLFFLYLSLTTMNGLTADKEGTGMTGGTSAKNVVDARLTFGIDVIGEMAIAIALAMAGLFVANKMSITGADMAMGHATNIVKGAGNKLLTKGRSGYGRLMTTTGMQERSIQWSREASKNTGWKRLALNFGAQGTAVLSAGAERAPQLTGDAKKKLEGMTTTELMARRGKYRGKFNKEGKWERSKMDILKDLAGGPDVVTEAEMVAMTEILKDRKDVPKMPDPGDKIKIKVKKPVYEDVDEEKDVVERDYEGNVLSTKKVKTGNKKRIETGEFEEVEEETDHAGYNRNVFNSQSIAMSESAYVGFKTDTTERNKALGGDEKMAHELIKMDMIKQKNPAGYADTQEYKKTAEDYEKAAGEFFKGLKKGDMATVGKALKNVFVSINDRDEKTLADKIASAMAKNSPQLVSSMLPNIGGLNVVNNFSETYTQQIEKAINDLPQDSDDERKKLKEILDKFTRIIIQNFQNFEGWSPTSASTPTQAP